MRATGSLGNARYERLATLASGGMGKVFLGRAQIEGAIHTVAIKVLHPHLAQEADMVAMFLDEARVSTKIHHPNVVHVWDVDLIGEELVIVMEYVEGATLAHMIRALRQRGESLPVGVVARVLSDALAGLHAAHELVDESSNPLGLVHRDVSPQNLLVGADGVTRVADFGVAISAGRLAQTKGEGVKGKLRYLAPEQVLRRPLDRRLDVFSAGIVLWEGLTGKRLFDGGTEAETLTKVMREPIAPPSVSRPEVPVALDEVCLKALERDPARRFETAEKFAAALELAMGDTMASPAEVGAVVMNAARDTVLQHRDTLERAENGYPGFDNESTLKNDSLADPSTAGVETESQAPRPIMRLALVAILCLLIGGATVRVATRGAPSRESPSASETSAATTRSPATLPIASVAASSSAVPPPPLPPPTASSSQAPQDLPPAPKATVNAKTPRAPVRKSAPTPAKPGDSFMPGGL